jgi:hypothetical protein
MKILNLSQIKVNETLFHLLTRVVSIDGSSGEAYREEGQTAISD